MVDNIDPVNLEGRLVAIEKYLEHIDMLLATIEAMRTRVDALEAENRYQKGYEAGQSSIKWRDALKIWAPLAAVMGLVLTSIQVLG